MDAHTAFRDALTRRDTTAALALLDAHPELTAPLPADQDSPLLRALYHGARDVALRLAAARPLTAFEAAAMGDVPELRRHLDEASATATIDALSADGWTALHLGAFFGHADVVTLLLASGAAIDARSTNAMTNTPLCAAIAGQGAASVAPSLIAAGADVNVRAAGGVTPLHLAASRGELSLIELLLERGASAAAVLDDGQTPAAVAASRGHASAAKRLGGTTTTKPS